MTELDAVDAEDASQALDDHEPADTVPEAMDAPHELSEAALEALLFVAEKPLTRREIAILAGVDRTVVDERLGDPEVSLTGRGIRPVASGERIQPGAAPHPGG